MKKLLLLPLALLAACGVTAPPREAQWTTTVRGVDITWRPVVPGALADKGDAYIGRAYTILTGNSCVVDIDMAQARHELARVAAHEAGHCLQARYLLSGIPRPDLGAYYAGGTEGFAETYAEAYFTACGDSLIPLGWPDLWQPTCTEAPDPHALTRP